MIANITSPSSLARALGYNFRKVEQGQADVIAVSGLYARADGRYALDGVLADMAQQLPARHRTRNAVFHCSLNPHPDERLTGETLVAIAREYMEGMGYGGQPYIVFRHRDIAREHIHIVAPRVDSRGRKINDSFERRRSQRVVAGLERRYGLRATPRGERPAPPLTPVEAARGDVRQQVRGVVLGVMARYAFQSLGEMNAVLNRYNVQAEEVRWEYAGRRLSGLVYVPLDARGERVGPPIRSKDLGRGAGQTAVQGKFRRSRPLVAAQLPGMRERVAEAMRAGPRTRGELEEALRARGIHLRMRTTDGGRIYGMTFMDDELGVSVNGSRLGRGFSARAFDGLLNGGPTGTEHTMSSPAARVGTPPDAAALEWLALGDGLLDGPPARGDEEWRELAWRRKLRREEAKRRRRG